MSQFKPLPPPPNTQSIGDQQGKPVKVSWPWADWFLRLAEKLKELTILPALGSANQFLSVNNTGTDLEYKTLQGTANEAVVNYSPGTATIVFAGPHAFTTQTQHGILLGQGSSPITATAVMTNGQLLVGQTGSDPLPKTMGGDATLDFNAALTLATVNASPGTYGDATHVAQVTVNAKGLATTVSNVLITGTSPGGAAGGDLSGTYPNPTVSKINGSTLGTTTPTAANLLIGDGSAWQTRAASGDWTISSTGVATLATVVAASTNTKITYNAKGLVTAGTPAILASADFANQGTTTTVLHGNVAGNPSWAAVSLTADVTGTLPATNGGTGLNSFAVGDLLYASTTTALSRLADVAAGSFLRSGGVSTAPAWSTTVWTNSANQGDILYASAANTYSNLAKDTNSTRYLSNTGSSNNPAWAQVSLTTGVSGVLPVPNGGTGFGSYTVGDLLYADTTTTLAKLSDVADGQVLGSKGVGVAPAYRTLASLGFAIDYANLGVAPTVAAGTDGIAIGDGASVGAGATNSVAIGQGASVGATFTNSTALGAGAVAGAANVVAIGNATNNGNASINISASPTAINLSNAQNALHIGLYRNGGQPFGVNGVVNDFMALGVGTNTDFAGEMSWSMGNFVAGTSGTAKVGMFPMRATTTNATITPLGTSAGANPTGLNPGGQIVLPTVSSWAFDCLIVARRTDATGTNAVWRLKFAAKKDANNASTALVGTRVKEILHKDAGAATWDVSVAVDTGTGAVYPTVTGEAAKTIRWVANVEMVKVMES